MSMDFSLVIDWKLLNYFLFKIKPLDGFKKLKILK